MSFSTTMQCSISGEVPQEPVVSVKTGHLYEKRLIEKHLEVHVLCQHGRSFFDWLFSPLLSQVSAYARYVHGSVALMSSP